MVTPGGLITPGPYRDSFLTRHPGLSVWAFPEGGCVYRRSVTVELDGKRWEPVPGGTATAAEFIAARAFIHQIHQQAEWSPWVIQDRAAEYDSAMETLGQWTITNPASHRKTPGEWEAELKQQLAEASARLRADQAQAEKDRAERAQSYHADRDRARLALLESQAILADGIRQRDEILSGDRFPLAIENDQRRLLAGLEGEIAAEKKRAIDLAVAVGDPETVADANGWLPAERRELALTLFKAQRETEVRDLRARVADGQAALQSLRGRSARAEFREALSQDQARLAYLEQMPPLEASGMCSECVSPAWHTPAITFHLDGTGTTGGPCPAWPRWAETVNAIRHVLLQASQRPPKAPPLPSPAPSKPLAVLAPGTAIEDVIAQLTAIQAGHPGAEVRQGKGHRWEIWPAAPEPARQAGNSGDEPGEDLA